MRVSLQPAFCIVAVRFGNSPIVRMPSGFTTLPKFVRRRYLQQKDFAATGQRLGPLITKRAAFSDDRIMRRIDGSHFWVTVCGFGYNPKRPFELAVWTFADLSERVKRPDVASTLTARERDVAAFLVHGLTSKEIGKKLSISPRTVDIHRASLLRKYGVQATPDLITQLLA